MKRLTDKRLAIPPGVWQEVTREQRMELQEIPIPLMRELYYRLSQIEDALGDEYDLDRLRVLCNQRMTMREEVSERFSLTAKIPLDRLREIAEADRDGRVVVLPCKLGDKLFYEDDGETVDEVVEKIVIDIETDGGIYKPRDIGYSVYLSPEAALKAREQE